MDLKHSLKQLAKLLIQLIIQSRAPFEVYFHGCKHASNFGEQEMADRGGGNDILVEESCGLVPTVK